MTTVGAWDLVLGAPLFGLGFSFGFVVVRFFANFIAGRLDRKEDQLGKKEAKIDGATQRLITNLEHRLDEETKSRIADGERRKKVERELGEQLAQVRKALEECQKQHADARKEVMELRGLMQGYGDANQDAQRIIAADHASRQKEAKN